MPRMRLWRNAILAIAVLQVLAFAVGLSLYPHLGDFGFDFDFGSGRLIVEPSGPVALAGLRSDDMLDAGDAAVLVSQAPLAHERRSVTVYRHGKRVEAAILASPASFPWSPSVSLRTFIGLLLVILGTFIVIRGDLAARTLWTGTFLVLMGWVALGQYLRAPGIAGLALEMSLFFSFALSLFAAVAILFTFEVATGVVLRVGVFAGALTCAAYCLAFILMNVASTTFPAYHAVMLWAGAVPILTATCYLVAFTRARGEQRRRLRVLAAAVVPYFVVIGVANAADLETTNDTLTYVARIFELTLPFGMAYALFVRRVIDIGFAINRAVVFALVSAALVGMFVLVEWAGAEWLKQQSHTTNLAIGAALALVLGVSMRFIHSKIDKFVDMVLFRKRHEDEQSIRRFAHETAFITDAETLVERALQTVRVHGDASSAEILLLDGGQYGGVSENDPAIVALKAWHKPLDLHTVATELRGEYAFALGSRGAVSGVILVGRKNSGESYAPDELEAIRALANATGNALTSLSREPEQSGILAAIETLHADLVRRFDTMANGAAKN